MMEKGVAIDSYVARIVLIIVYIINYTQLMLRSAMVKRKSIAEMQLRF